VSRSPERPGERGRPPRLPRVAGLPRLPGLHLPSILGRAWADRVPLLLAGLVVALATLLASALPQAMRSTADEAVNEAVARAGANAAITVTAPFDWELDMSGARTRPARTVEIVGDYAERARSRLGPDLAAALRPPLIAVTSATLQVSDHGPGRVMQLAYVDGGNGGRVDWTAGGPPKASVPEAEAATAVRTGIEPWPVQIGLSEQTAKELGAAAGDRIQVEDSGHKAIDVRVSGIFRPLQPADPAWQGAPELLQPLVSADGTGTRIEMAGLMSKDSLPDGRLALDENDMKCTITFIPEPLKLGWRNAETLAATVVALEGGSGGASATGGSFKWESGLDAVLQAVRAQVAAASAQASVLLVGLVATAVLVLLLAADLLVRRRERVLAGTRMRGASLAGIGAELLIESITVTLAGAAVGLLLARALAGGYSWAWLAPVVLVAILGGPVLGTRAAARATRGRQAPANRSARRLALRTEQLRRAALEITVALAAAAAFAALRQRGVVPAGPDEDGNILPAVAPTLGAATGALILLRLLPLVVQLALTRASRSRGSLPLFAAARAAVTAARPLPLVILIMSSALLTFALAVSSTENDGQAVGAWRTVNADARMDVTPDASVGALAQRVSASNGVREVVVARVADHVNLLSDTIVSNVRLVVVDAAAFRRLLADTPLPDAPQLDRLEAAGAGGRVPALLRSADSALGRAKSLSVRWNDAEIDLTAVGTAPTVGDGLGDVLIVDATAFAAAGAEAAPNTVWVSGPRAAEAVKAAARSSDVVTLREDVLAARRSAPLAAGLLHLAEASIVVLLLWGLLSVVLGAAASAPARGEMLARLRTLGLRPRESRRVAAGELLPPVIVGAVGGVAIGVLLAHASLGLLALRLLTGQTTDPALVVPWMSVVPVVVLMAAVVVVVLVESSLRRRERLGLVLRAGNL